MVYAAPRPFLKWNIIGSWPKATIPTFDPASTPDLSKEMTEGGQTHHWEEIRAATPAGRIDPGTILRPSETCWALAFTTFDVSTPGKQLFQVGSDDQMTVWIDGKKIYEFNGESRLDRKPEFPSRQNSSQGLTVSGS